MESLAIASPSATSMPPFAPKDAKVSQKFFSFIGDREMFLQQIKPPAASHITFETQGILFKANHVPDGNVSHLLIWGALGYLPYSVSSYQKRQNLIAILEGAHSLRHVQFGVDAHMQILVTGTYKISKPLTPDYLFVPLVRFLEESLPFIRLIGEFL